ncbi:MAG: AMP-binding protein [Myxococcales bacterium]
MIAADSRARSLRPEAGFSLLGRHRPASPVAWRAGQLLTAEDLRLAAARVAGALPEAAPDEEILLACGDRWHFAAALLAAWHRGYVVALPPNGQPQTVEELRGRPCLRRALHDGELTSSWDGALDVRTPREPSNDFPLHLEIAPDRPIATLFTSGTTGQRVAWRKTARQLLAEAEMQARLLRVEAGARLLATTPPQHIYGFLAGLLVPLVSGAAMVCGHALLPEALCELARASGATHLASVPAHLRALAAAAPAAGLALGAVRTVISSSAPLETELSRKLAASGLRLVELFGSTETGGIASRSPPEPFWQPLPGVSVRADREGRLLLDSPFSDRQGAGPQLTSDLIALRPSGGFEHLGRCDGVVKVGGRRVALQEIEDHLRGLPGVVDVASASFPSSQARGSEIWTMAVAPGLEAEGLRQSLLTRFDPVVVPRRIRILAALPREPSGKIPKAAWLRAFAERPAADPPDREDVVVRERLPHEQAGVSTVEIRLWVPPDLLHFRGHFDGFPILSGIFILNRLVLRESLGAWPDLGVLTGLSRVKFKSPVFPDTELLMTLERRARASAVEFSLAAGGRECACGSLAFRRAEGPA